MVSHTMLIVHSPSASMDGRDDAASRIRPSYQPMSLISGFGDSS